MRWKVQTIGLTVLQFISMDRNGSVCLASHLAATVLAYAWYFDGVKYLGAGNASAYIILVPILGILFSAVWLNEQVDSSLIIGGILAVSGLGIMHWGRRLIK